MKKKILLIVVFFFVAFPSFMAGVGEVSAKKKLSVIKTDYFDFIFPEESEPTAQHLAQHADDIYRKAADFLDIESTMRFPVVVTPETDVLNAYFNPFPVFRIVMYDTVPSESLAVFSDNLTSIFYHEVIHALSTTIRTPFWNGYSTIFGEIQSPWMLLNLTKAIAEGTAVLAESLDGEGRLNSAYALHVIKQAKIEGKFPDWRDITGVYQLYTSGSLPYIFGGAFLHYIYQTYGIEKFADFWYQLANFNFTFYEGVFKKVYAVSLDTVWKNFEDSIYIAPLNLPAQYLFLPESRIARTTSDQLYQNLAASPDGIAWQDGFTGTVYFLPNEAENQKVTTLYATDLTSRLHFSRDGKYLVSSGSTGGQKAKNTVKVYDMDRGKNIRTQRDLRDGAVINIPKNANIALESPLKDIFSVLAGVQTEAALASLVLYDMGDKADSEPLVTIPFERNNVLFKPVDAGNGLIIALMHNKGDWQFFVYDAITGAQRTYAIDEPFLKPSNIGDIYASDTMLYMSYAQTANSQPVLARINLADFNSETLTVYVQTEQLAGGVFNPVVMSDTVKENQIEMGQSEIAYISKYYEHSTLSLLSSESDDSFELITFMSYTDSAIATPIDFPIEPYRPEEYAKKGILIPLVGAVNFTPFTGFLPESLSIGASAMTIDPVGRLFLIGGSGYDIQTKNFTTALSTVFNERYFTATTDIFAASSPLEFETFASKLHANVRVPIGYNFNSLTFANTLSYFYLAEKNDYLAEGNTVHNTTSISFSHARRTGQFFYDRASFTFGAQVTVQKNFSNNATLDSAYAIFLGLQTPLILPFKNPDRFTLNFPGTVVGYKYFDYEKTWEIQSTFVLFAYDIQTPISFAPLFFRRITLDAGLNCVWYDIGNPELIAHSSLFFTLSPNISLGASSAIDLGVAVVWKPDISGVDGVDVNFKFALNL